MRIAKRFFSVIKPGESSLFRAAIHNERTALVLNNEGRLQQGKAHDLTTLEDIDFTIQSSREAITRSYQNFRQEEWNEFLSYLDSTLIQNLNPYPEHRRALIDSYNFCLSPNQNVRRNRSESIGKMPLLRFVLADQDNERNAEKYLRKIDANKLRMEIMREYFADSGHPAPWATNEFLYRMRLASSLSGVETRGNILIADAVDEISYGNKVKNIPDSDAEPQRFEEMWKVFDYLSWMKVGGIKAQSHLIANVKKNWERNIPQHESFSKDERDFFRAVVKDLVLPLHLSRLRNHYSEEHLQKDRIEAEIDALSHILAEKASQFLTPTTLAGYVKRWDRNYPVIEGKKPLVVKGDQPNSDKDEWHRIFADQTIDGYSYTALTNQSQLTKYSNDTGSCYIGFRNICMSAGANVISATSPSGEIFAIDLRRDENGKFYDYQVTGAEGSKDACSSEAKAAAKKLVGMLNSGEIQTNPNSGAIKEYESIESWLQFNPFSKEERDQVFKSYQDLRLLPKQWQHYKSAEDFAEGIGLEETIKETTLFPLPQKPSGVIESVIGTFKKLFGKDQTNHRDLTS